MRKINLEKMTNEYLQSCQRNWRCQKIGEEEFPINEVYFMLQSIETESPNIGEKRSELADITARYENAGLPPEMGNPRKRSIQVDLSKTIITSHHLILLGEPGAGKSTTLQYIGWSIANGA